MLVKQACFLFILSRFCSVPMRSFRHLPLRFPMPPTSSPTVPPAYRPLMKQCPGASLHAFITRNNVREGLIIKQHKSLEGAVILLLETSEGTSQRGQCSINYAQIKHLLPSCKVVKRPQNKINRPSTLPLSPPLKFFTFYRI